MEMASSEVEMSSCQTFNCVLSPHERCIRGDHNNNNTKKKKKNKNNNNVRNIHVAFEKNLKVFVRDPLENCSVVSGENCHDNNSTKSVPECSSNNKSSVSDHRLSKTDEAPSSSPLGSDPDPNFNNPGQPDKRNETMAASSLVQIWEARTTQHPNQNQSLIDSRSSSSGSIVLNESELIQPIEEGNNEEEEEEDLEEKMECDSGEKERVRVMDIIRKLSTDSETTANHDSGSSSNDNAKEIQTTEARCFPQVACSPRIRGRQAFADLLVQMTRDREKELACLSERHSVSKFTHRGRIQSTLRIRCYERCIAIQDRHRSKTSSAGSDLNRSPRGSGVMHLLREKYKTNSENTETGVLSNSRGRSLDKDAPKVAEKKVLQETMEKKSDIKEIQEVISAVETVKKAVLSESTENKISFKKSSGETIRKETEEGRGQKQETNVKAIAKETVKKAVISEKREAKEKDLAEESGQGKASMGIAEKVNLWNSEEKINRRKGKAESKASTERVEKNEVLEEAARRIINVESAERSIATSKETIKRCELAEEVVRRKKKEDFVSAETKSKQVNAQAEEKVLQETRAKSDLIETRDNKNGFKKPIEEESVEENSLMGIAEKVNMWNSKERRNRRKSIDRGKGKTEGKANARTNQVLQEASRRITNVETAERSITTSKENVEKVVGNKEMMGIRESNKETTQCESEEKGRRKKEEDLAFVEAKSTEIIEVKNMNPQEVTSQGSRERAKEIINSSLNGEVMSVLRNPEANSTEVIERNDFREIVIEEASASDGSRVRAKESEDEVTKKVDLEEKGENVQETAIELFSVWEENEVEEEEEEDYGDYGDYDHYNGDYSYDWVNDISRPRSYWEDLRKERYLEVLNGESEKKDICNLIERRTVSDFLTSDLRQKIDNLMINRVQNHLRVPVDQEEGNEEEDEEEEEEWEEECSPRNQEDNETEEEPEKTNLEDASDNCSQSSARSCTLMMSWSFRDQDIDKDQEPTTLSLPEPPVPTNQPTQEMQMISDLRGQMEQMQREMLELRNTVTSCIDMQLHFQKSVTQDFSRSEQRVETKKDPLQRKCCVCLEMPVDSLLYRCGHMCTCLKCAHELQWSSKKCPICMAPIVDVVRAFLDS